MAVGSVLILNSTSGQPKQVQAADNAYVNDLDTPDSSVFKIGSVNASTVGLGLSTTASHYAIEVVNDPTYRTITLGGGGLSDTTILLGVTADTSYPIFANEGQTGASLDHNPGIRWNGSAWQSKILGDPLTSAPWTNCFASGVLSATQYSTVDWIACNPTYATSSNTVPGQTCAMSFKVYGLVGETIKISGVRFYAKYSVYPRTVRCRLWYLAGGTLPQVVDVVVAAEGVVTATFPTPYTVPASEYMVTGFMVSVWDNSGGSPLYYTSFANTLGLAAARPTSPFFWKERQLFLDEKNWASGNASPTGTATTERYPLEPIVTVS